MTQAEKILIRYLSAASAALAGISAALIGFETDVSQDVIIIVTVVSAGLSGFVASLTGEAISRTLGIRKSE